MKMVKFTLASRAGDYVSTAGITFTSETRESFDARCIQIMEALKAWNTRGFNFRTIDWTAQTGNPANGIQHRMDFEVVPVNRGDRLAIIDAVRKIQAVKFS